MKQNMNIGQYVTGATAQTNDSNRQKYCYGDNPGNCPTDGGLYQWNEAMQYSTSESAQGICPSGWHLPTDAEQNILDQYLNNTTCNAARVGSGCANAGTKLLAGGTSGFEGLLAGYRYSDGSFANQGAYVNLWSSSINGSNTWYRHLDIDLATITRSSNARTWGWSVRCLRN